MVDGVEQRTLEGLVVTDEATLERIVERVLAKHGILELAKRSSKWDRGYKGDAFWLEFRAHVLQLVRRNVAVAFTDLDQDRYFATTGEIRQRTQWHRALDQHLAPNAPRGSDAVDVVTFAVGGRRFATGPSSQPCAPARDAGERGGRTPRARGRYGGSGSPPASRGGPAVLARSTVTRSGLTRVTGDGQTGAYGGIAGTSHRMQGGPRVRWRWDLDS